MSNSQEDWLIRRIDRNRRIQAEAEERRQNAEQRLTITRQTWRELCRGRRVYDIALFRKAAEAFILAKEGHDAARDVVGKARDLPT
ncbi:MAG: hypothetical protein AAB429_02805 [Patescibacteria group bacterium]